jgi:hypothetical protein
MKQEECPAKLPTLCQPKPVKWIDITEKAKITSDVSVWKSNINMRGNENKNVTLGISVQPLLNQ